MDLKYWAATDVGRKRTHNEDNFLIDKNMRLFVVADGMGGHSSGDVASAMAVHTIRDVVMTEAELFASPQDDPLWHMEVCMVLEHAVLMACETIYRKGVQEPEKKGMGTTVVALLIAGDRGYIAYVGDSRIYLLRGGIVYQLTEDHSLMNELIRQGKITAEAFDDSPYAQFKHAMTRAVGPNESVEVDTLDFDMIPGDSFLLCSDGLYEYLDDDDLSRMLSLDEIKDIPGKLIDMANTRGGKDNITALVIQVPENADGSDRAAEINFTLDTLKQIPLFSELNYQQLVRIMNLTRIVPFEPRDILCYEGQIGEELFVILRGEVDLYRNDVPFASLPQGAHFGEMALIDAMPRSATAVAATHGKLLMINREDFLEILRKEPSLATKLLWAFVRELGERLRSKGEEIEHTGGEEILELSDELLISEDSRDDLDRNDVLSYISESDVVSDHGVPSDTGSGPVPTPSPSAGVDPLAATVPAAAASNADPDTFDEDAPTEVHITDGSSEEFEAAPQPRAAAADPSKQATVPEPSAMVEREHGAPVKPTRITIPSLVNAAAGRFGTSPHPRAKPPSGPADIHTRATRPIGIPTDDDDDA
ncbi:protein phosphatase/cyclic nucleotide-binding domain protein [Plesiocystis pacifica SIR-1]|uniref:Protein phosphatase/cyclic nucleotide-binding domain protein n=1 Tax=Plesiocystis pacifica SIR-1 TaxID=391625 RepID=A6GAV1_9BACT|nr:Stp1/IreP family PP2C-type Ser/Thr phosphatase [Plesiocystis pacifica]EDM77042.1 protein phosphatase/cyclic nucleotide-binding domain protein [Plesiocystis pacifica SIR-1]